MLNVTLSIRCDKCYCERIYKGDQNTPRVRSFVSDVCTALRLQGWVATKHKTGGMTIRCPLCKNRR